jgi:hypothetical protein
MAGPSNLRFRRPHRKKADQSAADRAPAGRTLRHRRQPQAACASRSWSRNWHAAHAEREMEAGILIPTSSHTEHNARIRFAIPGDESDDPVALAAG